MERTSALWAAYGPFFGSNLLLVFSKVYVSYVRNIKCVLTKRCIISRELNFYLYYLSCWIESIPSLSARRSGMKEWASIEVKSSTSDQQVKGEPVDVIDRKQLKAAGGLHKLAPQPPHYTIHYKLYFLTATRWHEDHRCSYATHRFQHTRRSWRLCCFWSLSFFVVIFWAGVTGLTYFLKRRSCLQNCKHA